MPRTPAVLFSLVLGAATASPQAAAAPRKPMRPDTVLYGVAYYHEYMPYERLDQDIELMKRAGITVVRVGESTWTSWEPREGEFQFEWMDRVVDKMQAAGIKVVMGTPTYSVPPWLYAKHPEIMVVPLGQVRTPREFYGHAPEHGHHAPGLPAVLRARHPQDRRALREAPRASSAGRSTTRRAPTARPGRTCRPASRSG